MTCHNCRIEMVKAGFYGRDKIQRFKCQQCGKRFAEPRDRPLGDVRLPDAKVLLILNCLVEGNSIRSTARIADVEKRTVINLMLTAGEKCERLLEERLRNLHVADVQADEIWAFVGKKEGHKSPEEAHNDSIGDAYTFIAIERNTKLVISWHLGRRTSKDTLLFTEKIRKATVGHFQITTDGFPPYRDAIEYSLGMRCDFAQLVKTYAAPREGHQRYSPADITGTVKVPCIGMPDRRKICTSHVERQNGTLRQWCKRLTRLTYAFSKKWDNLKAALALHFAFYNFCRVHGSLRVTPAMEAGIANHVWTIQDLISTL